jgi:hypothetical protein
MTLSRHGIALIDVENEIGAHSPQWFNESTPKALQGILVAKRYNPGHFEDYLGLSITWYKRYQGETTL